MKDDLCEYYPLIGRSILFRDLSPEMLAGILNTMKARVVRYRKGEFIEWSVQESVEAALVLDGLVTASAIDQAGEPVSLQVFAPLETIGLEQALLGIPSGLLFFTANQDSRVMFFQTKPLRKAQLPRAMVVALSINLLTQTAENNIRLQRRNWILSQHSIRTRFRYFVGSLPREGDAVELPMSQTSMAAYLGVDRSALAREISRMKKEGLIEMDRHRLILKDRDCFNIYIINGWNGAGEGSGRG